MTLGQDEIYVGIAFDVDKVSVREQHRTKAQTGLSQTGVSVMPGQAFKCCYNCL